MPAPCSHGTTGASAESTERDQLAGERNVRDADSLVVATDHSGAQQHIHTADYWLHIYTLMWLCLHIHANFRAVLVILHVYMCLVQPLMQTRTGIGCIHFDRFIDFLNSFRFRFRLCIDDCVCIHSSVIISWTLR